MRSPGVRRGFICFGPVDSRPPGPGLSPMQVAQPGESHAALSYHAHWPVPNLGDRVIVALIDELEHALAIIESTERRSRSPASSTRLITATTATAGRSDREAVRAAGRHR